MIIHLIATAARMFAFHISRSLTSRIFLPFRGWLVRASSALARKKRKRGEKIEGILVKISENDSYSGRDRRCELSKCGRTRNSKKIRNDWSIHSTVAFLERNTARRDGNFALHSQLRERYYISARVYLYRCKILIGADRSRLDLTIHLTSRGIYPTHACML